MVEVRRTGGSDIQLCARVPLACNDGAPEVVSERGAPLYARILARLSVSGQSFLDEIQWHVILRERPRGTKAPLKPL